MNDTTKKNGATIRDLLGIYRVQMPEGSLRLYLSVFKKVDSRVLAEAARRWASGDVEIEGRLMGSFSPTPAELRATCSQVRRELRRKAENAYRDAGHKYDVGSGYIWDTDAYEAILDQTIEEQLG